MEKPLEVSEVSEVPGVEVVVLAEPMRIGLHPKVRIKRLLALFAAGWVLLALAWVVSIGVWWSMFRTVQVAQMPTVVAPSCLDFSTDVRASYNGYIIDHVKSGQMAWVTDLSIPYADITWYDAQRRAWREGNVPARLLVECKLGIRN